MTLVTASRSTAPRTEQPRNLKRMLYLAHRWIGIVLGMMVAVWFTSGIVMMYYQWPAYTESELLRQLRPFSPSSTLVGFAIAERVAEGRLDRLTFAPTVTGKTPVGGRLMRWGDRLAYQIWGEQGGHWVELALIDAQSGAILSPVSPSAAAVVAAERVAPGTPLTSVELLTRGDHYMENRDYRHEFPAYRIRFADAPNTAIYVEQRGGTAFGVATRATRLTTWLGTVPHWLYFQWLLQDREGLWKVLSIALPAVGILLALTGITLGFWQLFPNRRRGRWRPTAYRGVSKWHHLAGVVFGLLVLTWTTSGVLENLGTSTLARDGQASRVRGGPVRWDAIRVSEAEAIARLPAAVAIATRPIAMDLLQFSGTPGYDIHLADGEEYWVDAVDGTVRGDMTADQALDASRRVIGESAPVEGVVRLTQYDSYYHAGHGRQRHLPVWRVLFADADRSAVYLDPVNGTPVGFADREARAWRWARDGLHGFDYPFLTYRRPLWDIIVLPLLLGGAASALTGAWLLVRRVRRIT